MLVWWKNGEIYDYGLVYERFLVLILVYVYIYIYIYLHVCVRARIYTIT